MKENSKVYDPRIDRMVVSDNPVLLMADISLHKGFVHDWKLIAKLADFCDMEDKMDEAYEWIMDYFKDGELCDECPKLCYEPSTGFSTCLVVFDGLDPNECPAWEDEL